MDLEAKVSAKTFYKLLIRPDDDEDDHLILDWDIFIVQIW